MSVFERRPGTDRRSWLESPWLAAAIVAIVLGGGAALFLPSLLRSLPGVPGSPSGAPGATITATIPGPTFVRPTPSPQPSFTSYVVKSRDTLSSIAKRFDTTARSIAWWNRGIHPSLDPESEAYDPDRLELGWELLLLPGTVVDENNPPPAAPGPSPSSPGAG